METLKLDENVGIQVGRNRGHVDPLPLKGRFHLEVWDKDGNCKHREDVTNQITNVGKDALLDIMFHASTQITTWYFGLIDASGYTGISVNDTMASHSGWTEFTSYDEATRVEWTEDAASSQSITNTTVSTFNINASGTLKGAFVISNNTKSGSTGTLWSSVLFAADVAVSSGDDLKLTYTVSA